MLKSISIYLFAFFLYGCQCDEICVANKKSKIFMEESTETSEIIKYLETYEGEAVTTAKIISFINKGRDDPKLFWDVIYDKEIQKNTVETILYEIKQSKHKKYFCKSLINKAASHHNEKSAILKFYNSCQ